MTNSMIQDLKEEINFLRSQVVYLVNSGNEKKKGREYAIRLGRLTEQIETDIGFDANEKEQNLFDWAYGNWRMANDKFK